ncbi:MAG: MFS transporter, partial [Nocardiopsaceae bacterium]|nr:MFS transporter [Nocardiopsaceae bacterium]
MTKSSPVSGLLVPVAGPRRWAGFAVALSGTFLANVTVFIVVVALPSIGSQLGASGAQQQLILAGYELVYAIGVVPGGRLGDAFGQFRVFGAGMGLFIVASAGCALAPSATLLVGARLVQAAGTALIVPQVYSLARTLFGSRERARAFALAGVVMGAGAIAGQALGGLLISVDPFGMGWRVIFWLNLPVGAAALALLPAVAVRARRAASPG